MKTERLAVILPAFNEGRRIASVVKEALAVAIANVEISIVVINDGSRDDTAAVAAAAGAIVLSHPKNRGVGAAFQTGLAWAIENDADYLLHMDSDGQVLPREIPLVFGPIQRGEADLSIGSRFLGAPPENLTGWKAAALKQAARAIGIVTGYPQLTDLSCGFRCMNRRIFSKLTPAHDYDYIQETLIQSLALRARLAQVAITVLYEKEPERKGLSQQTFRYSRRFLMLTGGALIDFYRHRLLG